MTVGAIIGEPLVIHGSRTPGEYRDAIVELLETVGLQRRSPAALSARISGGQRQRIGIARALAVSPKLIVCDEPVSALDVSIQAQVINLLEDLQHKFDLAYLFIAHDLSVVEHISDRVAVMYLGRIVELASARELYTSPRHPYTEALLSAVPVPEPGLKRARIRPPGRDAQPDSAAVRLSLSSAVPKSIRPMQGRVTAVQAGRGGSLGGVPLERHDDAG